MNYLGQTRTCTKVRLTTDDHTTKPEKYENFNSRILGKIFESWIYEINLQIMSQKVRRFHLFFFVRQPSEQENTLEIEGISMKSYEC